MGNDWGPETARHRGTGRMWRAVWAVLAIVWFTVKQYAGVIPWEYIFLCIGMGAILLLGFK